MPAVSSWKTRTALIAVLVVSGVMIAASAVSADSSSESSSSPTLTQARYSPKGELLYPEDAESWITLGASIGGDYAEGHFDPKDPGPLGVVQIEPNALRVLRETGRFPDGTMLLLSFYKANSKSDPPLRGFTQGELEAREIHVIDRKRFPEEGRAFFTFSGAETKVGRQMKIGSSCVECHTQHGKLDATFAQFYPPIRKLVK